MIGTFLIATQREIRSKSWRANQYIPSRVGYRFVALLEDRETQVVCEVKECDGKGDRKQLRGAHYDDILVWRDLDADDYKLLKEETQRAA